MNNAMGVAAACLIGLGLAFGGWFIGDGFYKGRAADRYVTVKGLSERDVTADVALWPLRFVSTDDDLAAAQERIRQSHEAIRSFLKRHGIDRDEAEVQKLEVTDRLADPYRSGPIQTRYIIAQTVMVRSKDPESIARAGRAVGELVDAGVVLSADHGPYGGPTFLFTRLSDVKPGMIAEATAEARRAAEQFAKDSGSRTGSIRKANQGVFQILPRDSAPGVMEGSRIHKKVRVVSTVEYYLVD